MGAESFVRKNHKQGRTENVKKTKHLYKVTDRSSKWIVHQINNMIYTVEEKIERTWNRGGVWRKY